MASDFRIFSHLFGVGFVFKMDNTLSHGRQILRQPQMLPEVQGDIISTVILACCAVPAWHVLPIFIDLKIAADPALPGLTQDTLPIATTVT